jgi:uncharacterized protein with HEPN domain
MWRDLAWVLDMLLAVRKILEYAQNLTEARFASSTLHQDAILRQMTVLGEAAKRVSDEFREEHHETPWKKIAGFRDVAVHDYPRIELQRVWRIVQVELPPLLESLDAIVPPEDQV